MKLYKKRVAVILVLYLCMSFMVRQLSFWGEFLDWIFWSC